MAAGCDNLADLDLPIRSEVSVSIGLAHYPAQQGESTASRRTLLRLAHIVTSYSGIALTPSDRETSAPIALNAPSSAAVIPAKEWITLPPFNPYPTVIISPHWINPRGITHRLRRRTSRSNRVDARHNPLRPLLRQTFHLHPSCWLMGRGKTVGEVRPVSLTCAGSGSGS